ncbi:hypothetical protein [Geopsychrobacter electrodiphilus]|uniref:hypothetical protein n=1 Tax=Geopsychrobacter electrodiphilus TaxID=225196 RepID=UPI00038162E5|nr:hypothetical protein [Geopsychrobacter electrodiphilus]
MSEPIMPECKDSAGHHLHICQLRTEGRQKEVSALMTDPGYICLNCNAVAHNIKNLCNPISFSKA